MQRNILLLFGSFLLCSFCYSQNPIEINYDVDIHGNYSFYCCNRDFCTYTLSIEFTQLLNFKSDFIYLLPIGNGKEAETFRLDYLRINAHDPEPKD
jgi:hypothetical protein